MNPSEAADKRILNKVFKQKQDFYLKRVKRYTYLIWCTQTVMLLMVLAIIVIGTSINFVLMGTIMVGYATIGSLISAVIILRNLKRHNKMNGR